MKRFLDALLNEKRLVQISEELSIDFEVASVLSEFQETAILFKHVKESKLRVAGNLLSNRSNLGLGLIGGNRNTQPLTHVILDSIRNPSDSKGRVSGFDKSIWDVNDEADLTRLPVLRHFNNEAGRYVTAGIVAARFPGTADENLSFHRMLVLSNNKVAARIVPRHLKRLAKDSKSGFVPVTLIIGPPPAVFLSASLQVDYGLSEYKIANKLSGGKLELMESEQSDVAFPTDSEIVLEGRLELNELALEGPFVDLTGTYDEVRRQPTITFDRMHYRHDSVYQAIVASKAEHSIFMGLPQELKIIEFLSKSLPRVRGVNLTPASNGYFHCVVSIDKDNDGDGKTAITNCFAASHPLKLVVAVDADIDPFDLSQVEWALATRFQAERGLVVINGARGSSLDPSSSKLAITSKLGLDATLPLGVERSKFMMAETTKTTLVESVIKSLRRRLSDGLTVPARNASQLPSLEPRSVSSADSM